MKHRRNLVLAVGLLAATGCSSDDDPMDDWVVGEGAPVRVNGMMFIFGPNSGGLTTEGAVVSVAEAPELSTTVAADGSFSFDVPSGAPVSFSLRKDGFHPNQSAAIDLGAGGLARLGFQAPTEATFAVLGTLAAIEPDPKNCQISTTISRTGTEPYGGDALGVEGAVASIDPPLPATSGPIYFAYVGNGVIFPDPTLKQTSIDGGVIFANVPVGEYTLTASKAGLQFSSVTIRCRAGVLVNAAPPNGLQQL